MSILQGAEILSAGPLKSAQHSCGWVQLLLLLYVVSRTEGGILEIQYLFRSAHISFNEQKRSSIQQRDKS